MLESQQSAGYIKKIILFSEPPQIVFVLCLSIQHILTSLYSVFVTLVGVSLCHVLT